MNTAAIKDLLFRLADDDLILGHRNSEWTGIGPVLEEDIAFASMAQDQVGHAQAWYQLLHEMGEAEPDQTAFARKAAEFRSCHFVEYPIGDYAFSLVRHFLYDYAKYIRLQQLAQAAHQPIRELAQRLLRELKYHVLHARTWVIQLGQGSDEARLRLQSALREAYPLAFSLFEPTAYTDQLAHDLIQPHETILQERWQDAIGHVLKDAGLTVPEVADTKAHYGGRAGYHSEHLEALLNEMTEVFQIDPAATW